MFDKTIQSPVDDHHHLLPFVARGPPSVTTCRATSRATPVTELSSQTAPVRSTRTAADQAVAVGEDPRSEGEKLCGGQRYRATSGNLLPHDRDSAKLGLVARQG
jgi:hypothetical protein